MAAILERLDALRLVLQERLGRAWAELLGPRDRYRLISRLGRGGMGEVWLAEDRMLSRRVAVKLASTARGGTPGSPARFEREIFVTRSLAHPHTVRVYDHGTTRSGLRYYVMELVEGRNLAELLDDEGPLDALRAVELTRQAASALAEAHGRGLVHRDVKLENLVLEEQPGSRGFLKLVDFGLALDHGDLRLTAEGVCAGSPSSISPEVIKGGAADSRSDIYALGCVLYSLLAGRAPFVGVSTWDVLSGHLHQDPEPPSTWSPRRVPEELDGLVLRCLDKDPRWRPADAGALLEELVQFVADEAARARAPRVASLAVTSPSPSASAADDPFGGDDAEAHTTFHRAPAPAADFDDLATRDVCGDSAVFDLERSWIVETHRDPRRSSGVRGAA